MIRNPGARIRLAGAADAAAIADVHVNTWQEAYRGLLPQEFLDGLDPDRRRVSWDRGVGRAMMDGSLAALGEAGFREATLWVLAANRRGRRFYEAGGWRPDGTVRRESIAQVEVTEVRYRRSVDQPRGSGA